MLFGKASPKQCVKIELPYCVVYLWQWFCELSNSRDYGMVGPKPLSYSEIQAWSQLTKIDPTAWEVQAIKAIDRVFIAEAGKK
ncbi:MAG: hypothetical protein KAJ90_08130 [Desulfobacterales bacterium]|nr:hypothetical protein [Desulfobacterales bacterium]